MFQSSWVHSWAGSSHQPAILHLCVDFWLQSEIVLSTLWWMVISEHTTLFWQLARHAHGPSQDSRGMSNIWGHGMYPEFIKFIGVLVTNNSNCQKCAKKVHFTSKVTDFFQWCKFFHLLKMDNLLHLTSGSIPPRSVCYQTIYSIQVLTTNCPQIIEDSSKSTSTFEFDGQQRPIS